MITKEILLAICPQANETILNQIIDPLNKYLPLYQIDSLLRLSNFLGQAAEESDSFKTMTEYASGAAYEGRKDLGNTQKGDGVKFKGRGLFELTGRSNYESEGKILGFDLVNKPELAATGNVAVQTACLYWKNHNLNALADRNDVVGITEKINGGTNGLSVRQLYTFRATTVLKPLFTDGKFFSVPTINITANTILTNSNPNTVISVSNTVPKVSNIVPKVSNNQTTIVDVKVPVSIIPLPEPPPLANPEVLKPIMKPEEHAEGVDSLVQKIKEFFDLGSDFWKNI